MERVRKQFNQLLKSAGMWHGLIMTGSTLLAGFLDYLYNVLTGRMLIPVEYSILISVQAILQILLHVTNVIRNVVAYYTAEISGQTGDPLSVALFLRRRYRWAWRWGIVAMLTMALLSPLLARLLQLTSLSPLWAASLALLMLFVRPVTDGTLQGIQYFRGLASVTVFQALLRLVFAIILIQLGLAAFGAVLALPLATSSALLLALWFLQPHFKVPTTESRDRSVSLRYSMQTLVGLLAFALLVNMDAIFVRAFFTPEVAGGYAPVVTIGKINLFIPLALAMVLFPKAVQRHAKGQDARPILGLALVAALLPGLGLTGLLFVASGPLITLLFGPAYGDPGMVLGLVGLATTLFAGLNLWLNYALSTERPFFVYGLALVTLLQGTAMFLFHRELVMIAGIMVVMGILGNILGALLMIPLKK